MPVVVALELALLPVMAVLMVVGAVFGLVDRRLRVLRLAAMAAAYISVEVLTLLLLLGVWVGRPLRGRDWWDRSNLRLVAWALGGVLGAAKRTVGFTVSMNEPPAGQDTPLDVPGPVLVMARHGGIGDSFTLVWLLAARYGRRPRVVLKSLLLWEPMIDVALTRMRACFLPPAARRGEGLDRRVAAVASDLDERDALLLFPEGGNWTPRRRLRAIGRLWAARKPEAVKAAALMEHVLPPRTGGVLACLDARPELPVVVFAHTGLDKLTTAGEVWKALPFSDPMTVRWWPAPTAPTDEDGRVAWLTAEWAVIDEWIDATRASQGAVTRA